MPDDEDEGTTDDDSGGPEAASCDGEPAVGAGSLRRLTRDEYDHAVADLLGDETAPGQTFTADEVVGGYLGSIARPSEREVEQYYRVAEALAERAVEDGLEALIDCDPNSSTCADTFIESFGRKLLRRPLEPEQLAAYRAVYDDVSANEGGSAGIGAVLTALLTSPQFLYVMEFGTPSSDDDGVLVLDGYSVATRLSLFLWSTVPDDALLDAAERGELDDASGIAAAAERMLEDPRAEQGIAEFHQQWLEVGPLEALALDSETYPGWTEQAPASAEAETSLFAVSVILDGDAKLSSLLTADHSFVDATLAELYGVEHPGDDPAAFVDVPLPANERAGLITQISVLASHASPAVIHRGKLIRERFLCEHIPTPPSGAVDQPVDRLDPKKSCSVCHLRMDPIGMGLLQYDASGAFRLEDEFGNELDGRGEIITGPPDLEGTFEGPRDLAEKLATSSRVADCVAEQWSTYALRRPQDETLDECAVADAQAAFAESGGDIRSLLIELATAPSFRMRRLPTE